MVMEDLQPIKAEPRKGSALKFIVGGVIIVARLNPGRAVL